MLWEVTKDEKRKDGRVLTYTARNYDGPWKVESRRLATPKAIGASEWFNTRYFAVNRDTGEEKECYTRKTAFAFAEEMMGKR